MYILSQLSWGKEGRTLERRPLHPKALDSPLVQRLGNRMEPAVE